MGPIVDSKDAQDHQPEELQEIHRVLEQRNRELAILNHLSQAITSTMDLNQVLVTALEEIHHELDVVSCSIWLLDPQTNELVCQESTDPKRKAVRGWRLGAGKGITGWVLQHGESAIVADSRTDKRHAHGLTIITGTELRSILTVPLRYKEKIIGVIEVVDTRVNRFKPSDQNLVELIAAPAAVAIENARLYSEVQRLAVTDDLTGLYNRRHFDKQLSAEFQRARRYSRPLGLLIIDIDLFKRVNDRFGHLEGDRVLAEFASMLRQSVRETDFIARFGGDEFTIILPETDLNGTVEAANRIRQSAAAHIYIAGKERIQLTVSIGTAAIPNQLFANPTELFQHADRALLEAKQLGRDQVSGMDDVDIPNRPKGRIL
jgi:diguanylate cyclase (GGDEF)-like protein